MSRITTWAPRSGMGIWSVLGPAAAEAISHGAPGWMCLDGQHGFYDDRAIREALHVITSADVLVRVPALEGAAIGRALDAGARGVIIPMIETPEEAAQAAAAVRYPPLGARSWGPFAESWGRPEIPVGEADTHVVCGVMIETRRGLDQVDEIAAVPGIDLILVGPYDLSISLQTSLDALLAGGDGELSAVVSACNAHAVIPGIYAGTSERAARLAELGFELIAASSDRQLLLDGVTAVNAGRTPTDPPPR